MEIIPALDGEDQEEGSTKDGGESAAGDADRQQDPSKDNSDDEREKDQSDVDGDGNRDEAGEGEEEEEEEGDACERYSSVLLASVPMTSVTLVFWAFVSSEVLVLITSTAGFTLRLTPPPPLPPPLPATTNSSATSSSHEAADTVPLVQELQKPKPIKILDRIDLDDLSR